MGTVLSPREFAPLLYCELHYWPEFGFGKCSQAATCGTDASDIANMADVCYDMKGVIYLENNHQPQRFGFWAQR